jgi:cell division protein FtsA
MVLTGGASALPGIKRVAGDVLGMPIRVAQPENLSGLVDRLNSPAYSTGVGLLRWVLATQDVEVDGRGRRRKGERRMNFGVIKRIVGRILP